MLADSEEKEEKIETPVFFLDWLKMACVCNWREEEDVYIQSQPEMEF